MMIIMVLSQCIDQLTAGYIAVGCIAIYIKNIGAVVFLPVLRGIMGYVTNQLIY